MNTKLIIYSSSRPHGREVASSAVPRKGDNLTIDGDVYVVREVNWVFGDEDALLRVDVFLETLP